jgi:hypothetical protein
MKNKLALVRAIADDIWPANRRPVENNARMRSTFFSALKIMIEQRMKLPYCKINSLSNRNRALRVMAVYVE